LLIIVNEFLFGQQPVKMLARHIDFDIRHNICEYQIVRPKAKLNTPASIVKSAISGNNGYKRNITVY